MSAPALTVPRRDPTPRAALATVERAEQGPRLWVTMLDGLLAKYDERPSADRAAVLAIMHRAQRAAQGISAGG